MEGNRKVNRVKKIIILIWLFLFGIEKNRKEVLFFPICKRNEIFGLKHRNCFASEDLWHKIHVRATIIIIHFAILNLSLIFIKNAITKKFYIVILTAVIIVKYADKDYFKGKKEEEKDN